MDVTLHFVNNINEFMQKAVLLLLNEMKIGLLSMERFQVEHFLYPNRHEN